MNVHMLAFAGAALDASAGDVLLNAVVDPVFQRQNNQFQIPSEHLLIGGYAGCVNMSRARFNMASWRQRGFPQIYPFNGAVAPGDVPDWFDMREYPLTMHAQENLECDVTNAAAVDTIAFGMIAQPSWSQNINTRGLRWIRYTSSLTGVALSWSTLGAITFQETLEAGQYAVYGFTCVGALVLGARLLFPNQLYRPGTLGSATTGQKIFPFPYGGLGLLGVFNTYSLPQLETFESAAGASTPSGVMLVGKI